MSEPNTSTEKSLYIILNEQIEKSKLQGTMKVVLQTIVGQLAFSYKSDLRMLDLIQEAGDSTHEIIKIVHGLIDGFTRLINVVSTITDKPKDLEEIKSQVDKLNGFIPTLESLDKVIQNASEKMKQEKETVEKETRDSSFYG
jgi:hypothetical protein